MNKKFYITTPIYYANGLPHIGHLLTTTCADALARHYRLLIGDENVFFTTGMDEHGTTVESSAKKEGYSDYQKYVDKRSVIWEESFKNMRVSYDFFVRTTNKAHEKLAQDFIRKLVKAGDVYKKEYKGKYCYGCENFLTLSDLDDRKLCPLHRKDQVIEVSEENYFFRLSKYADKIKNLIKTNKLRIYPKSKGNEIISRIKIGVDDLSISRPKEKVSWGIEFPDDPTQTIYVWVEALVNYLSSLEINNKPEFWDYATHVLGKDINWFHNFIWPAMLISAKHPVHKKAFVHSFLNIGGQKISKSLGNVISPLDLAQKYGFDGARYVVLANTPCKSDVNVDWNALNTKYNADLANGLGNLVSRVSKLAEGLSVPFVSESYPKLLKEYKLISKAYEEFRLQSVIEELHKLVHAANEYLSDKTPWLKEGKEKEEILIESIKKILVIAQLAKPIMPETSDKLAKLFSYKPIKQAEILFKRV